MNKLYAGFARVDVTPMTGIGIAGYYEKRYSEGVLDELKLDALALSCGDDKVLLVSIDNLSLKREVAIALRESISEETGLPTEAIYLHATHTHTGPFIRKDSEDILLQEYYQLVRRRMCDASKYALEDLKPAKMGWGIGNAPNIAFVRRFRMKDGSVRTNPGVNNPDILCPIGDVDERVTVLRFDREHAASIVLVHFGNHPDTVGGCKISADWPGFLRKTVEKTIQNASFLMEHRVM